MSTSNNDGQSSTVVPGYCGSNKSSIVAECISKLDPSHRCISETL